MAHPNLDTIDKFFEAYVKRDMAGLRRVLSEDVTWTFPGQNPLSGTKAGIESVVAFFDAMGAIMGSSKVSVEKLATGVNDDYVVECQHIRTNREDGNNLDHRWCVLWKFQGGKIVEGKHFAEDQHKADKFYKIVAGK